MKKQPKSYGYGHTTDRALAALIVTSRSLVGDTTQARDLIMALCDQSGSSLEAQRAIRVLITPELCVNCSSRTHARCCAYCGKVHAPKRLDNEHCSVKCEAAAARADRISDAMEQDAMTQGAAQGERS